MAKLYFRYGAMGSSKTANAIMVQYNYGERHQKVLMVKPQLENRDGARIIRSRSGLETECVFAEELEGMEVSEVIPVYRACAQHIFGAAFSRLEKLPNGEAVEGPQD